jgi:DNA-binding LytR/AlgR family response regulator
MSTAIIAEDESPQRIELRAMLAQLWPELRIVAECADGAEARAALESFRPAIAFLDIRMPREDGIAVARGAPEGTHIVFITAYDQFAVSAFEEGAVDYLLKPVQRERLETALNRIRRRLGDPPDISQLLATLQAEFAAAQSRRLRWITAGEGPSVKLIPIEDVLFFQSQDKYTRVVTAREETHIRRSLKELYPDLDPTDFWQVHRSVIVRVSAIQALHRLDGDHVLSITGRDDRLPVARAWVPRFRGM